MWVPTLLFVRRIGGYVTSCAARCCAIRSGAKRGRYGRRRALGRLRRHRAPRTAPAESTVRIDDDDFALHNHDTVDLTGLYEEEALAEQSRTPGELSQRAHLLA